MNIQLLHCRSVLRVVYEYTSIKASVRNSMHVAPLLAFTRYKAIPFPVVTGSLTGVTRAPFPGGKVDELYLVCLGFVVTMYGNVREDTNDNTPPKKTVNKQQDIRLVM